MLGFGPEVISEHPKGILFRSAAMSQLFSERELRKYLPATGKR